VQSAMSRIADALGLLLVVGGSGCGRLLPDCDRKRAEEVAFPVAVVTLLRLATSLTECSYRGATEIAWQAVFAAQRFAALDAAQGCRSEPKPLFAHLPAPEELLVRAEFLAGGMAHSLGAARGVGNAAAQERQEVEPPPSIERKFAQLQRQLARVEQWLQLHRRRVAEGLEAVSARLGPLSSAPGVPPSSVCASDVGCATARTASSVASASKQQQLLQATWHYERSIRMLPKPMQPGGPHPEHLMLVLATVLIEAGRNLATIPSGAFVVPCQSSVLMAIVDADRQLHRAEGISDVVGHLGLAALVQANRAYLRVLAADVLVARMFMSKDLGTQQGVTELDTAELMAIRSLCNDDAGEEGSQDSDDAKSVGEEMLEVDKREDSTEGRCRGADVAATAVKPERGQVVARLGDQALALAMEAERGIDSVVEPDVAAVVALMASGALQAVTMQLLTLPPLQVAAADSRRAALSMLAKSLQVLPSSTRGVPERRSLCDVASVAHTNASLAAHAHLLQSEIHIDTAGTVGAERKQLQQRVVWHLERARIALHGSNCTNQHLVPILVHVHIAHSQLLSNQASWTSRRQADQALKQAVEELVAACHAVGAVGAAAEGELAAPSAELAPVWRVAADGALSESRDLLMQRLRSFLREICTREATSMAGGVATCSVGTSGEGSYPGSWKALYRAVLQLSATDVASVPALCASLLHGNGT